VHLLHPWHANVSKRLIKSPKLYFYDVGLASYLLGLENEKQVSRDPLRGNLFENMVVMEALKYRYNQGKRSNLFFFRDSNGSEVDLIAEQGRNLAAVEIKAGATINSDYFKGLRQFRKVTGESHTVVSGLIYGGEEVQKRSDTLVHGVMNCHALFEALLDPDSQI